jgi:hypothetical protein
MDEQDILLLYPSGFTRGLVNQLSLYKLVSCLVEAGMSLIVSVQQVAIYVRQVAIYSI